MNVLPEPNIGELAQRAKFLTQRSKALFELATALNKEASILIQLLEHYEQSSKTYVDLKEDINPNPLENVKVESERKVKTERKGSIASDCKVFIDLLFDENTSKEYSIKDLEYLLDKNQVPYRYNTLCGILYNKKNAGSIKYLEDKKKYIKVVK